MKYCSSRITYTAYFILVFFLYFKNIASRELKENDSVTFRLVLRQCNQDKLETFVKRVADIDDKDAYGKFLSPRELQEMLKCEHFPLMRKEIFSWLKNESSNAEILSDTPTSIIVKANGLELLQLFPHDEFYFDEAANRILLVNDKQVQPTLPNASLMNHVPFILGFQKSKMTKITNSKVRKPDSILSILGHQYDEKEEKEIVMEYGTKQFSEKIMKNKFSVDRKTERKIPSKKNFMGNLESENIQVCSFEVFNAPNNYSAWSKNMLDLTTMMELYGVPNNVEKYYDKLIGIAEFRGQWSYDDLKKFLSHEQPLPGIPSNPLMQMSNDMNFIEGEVESNLDSQMVAGFAQGVPIASYNAADVDFPLSWLLDVLEDESLLPPSGPYVWSVSYSLPEVFLRSGKDYKEFINHCETQFASLAALGITVIISSGDDGSCNGNPACEADPTYPISYGGSNNDDFNVYEAGSKCNSFVYKAVQGLTTYYCTAPMGYIATDFNIDIPGAQCQEVQSLCGEFLNHLGNFTFDATNEIGAQCSLNLHRVDQVNDDGLGGYLLNSNCTCDSIATLHFPTKHDGVACSVSGFEFDKEIYSYAYWASYPAASQYVTAVASTEVPYPGKGCTNISETVSISISPGGGFSTVIKRPLFQQSVVEEWIQSDTPKPNQDLYNSTNRGYPDVAALGQNVPVVIDGVLQPVAGTSAAAPIIASIVARLNNMRMEANLSAIGELNPHLYRMNSSAFNKLPQVILTWEQELNNEIEEIVFWGGNNISNHLPPMTFATLETFTPDENLPWNPVFGLGTPIWSEWEAYFIPSTDDHSGSNNVNPTPSPTPSPTQSLISTPAPTQNSTSESTSQSPSTCSKQSLPVGYVVLVAVACFVVGVALGGIFVNMMGKRKASTGARVEANSYVSFSEDLINSQSEDVNNIRSSHNLL